MFHIQCLCLCCDPRVLFVPVECFFLSSVIVRVFHIQCLCLCCRMFPIQRLCLCCDSRVLFGRFKLFFSIIVRVFHTQRLCQCCDPRVLFVLCAGLELEECPVLKTPPKEIRAKGFLSTYAFLKRLLSGSVECKRTKLMMVGLGGAGKTR